jgi:hypothetical protein
MIHVFGFVGTLGCSWRAFPAAGSSVLVGAASTAVATRTGLQRFALAAPGPGDLQAGPRQRLAWFFDSGVLSAVLAQPASSAADGVDIG